MVTIRSRRIQIGAVTLALMAIVVGVPIVAEASGTDPSASSVINAAKTEIARQSGVHVLLTSKTSSLSTNVVADIGSTVGVETITQGSDLVTIEVTPTYAYLSGNAAGLTSIMGLSTTEQKKVGTDSISMKVGTSPYKSLKSSVTTPVLASILPAVKGTSLSTVVINGQHYYELNWATKATSSTSKSKSVMVLSEGAPILPSRESGTSSSGTSTTTFSKWGENINVSIPAASRIIPYATVFG